MALDQVDIDTIDDPKEMSFFEHLEELRWHIIRSFIAIFVVAIVVFLSKDWVFNTIIFGPKNPDFLTYRAICWLSNSLGLQEGLCFSPVKFDLQAVDFGETLTLHMTVSFMLGIVVSFPYIFWEFWRFVSPGLKMGERRSAIGVVGVCSLLFFMGIAFGYYIIAAFGVNFLASYELPGVLNQPKLSSYINYLIMFVLPAGIMFEMPLVAYFLAKIGILSTESMRSGRRYAILVIVIVAAIITPPDWISQMIIGIPMYILYESSIYVVQRVERKNKETLPVSV